MANFGIELAEGLIKELEQLKSNSTVMAKEMTQAGAEKVYPRVISNMKKAFKHSDELINSVKITKPYYTRSDDGINTKVASYGYIKTDKVYSRKNNYKSKRAKAYASYGQPAPFVIIQREYGNSRGEKQMPIFRTAFISSEIENAMRKVEEKYLPKE